MPTVLPGRPPITIGGEWRPPGKGPHDDVEVRVAYALFHIDSNVRYHDTVELQEFRITRSATGWYVMLKGIRKQRKVVAFLGAADFRDALSIAATMADCQYIPWQPDVWKPKKRRPAG